MLSNNPVILPSSPDLLLNPQHEEHPLILNGHLTLAAWPISEICSRTGEFCRKLQVQQMEFTSRKVTVMMLLV